MILIIENHYSLLASMLTEKLEECGDYFNGKVEADDDSLHLTLTCTLILYRNKESGEISDIVPVWWELASFDNGIGSVNDFSWREFSEYLF